MRKRKTKPLLITLVCIFVFIVICFVSLGYAAFGSELSISNIVADVRVKSDIRITDVSITDGKYYNLDGFNYDVDSIILGEAFWELAKFRHPTHQIAFCTEEALKCIKFIGVEER